MIKSLEAWKLRFPRLKVFCGFQCLQESVYSSPHLGFERISADGARIQASVPTQNCCTSQRTANRGFA